MVLNGIFIRYTVIKSAERERAKEAHKNLLPRIQVIYYSKAWQNWCKLLKNAKKKGSKYGIFWIFFANTLGVLGNGLYFQVFLNVLTYMLTLFGLEINITA